MSEAKKKEKECLGGDTEEEEEGCDHEPEGHSVQYSGSESIVDVTCRKCGMSGSFRVAAVDVMWE